MPIRLCDAYPIDSETLNATKIQGRKVNSANETRLTRALKVERMAASGAAAACTKAGMGPKGVGGPWAREAQSIMDALNCMIPPSCFCRVRGC